MYQVFDWVPEEYTDETVPDSIRDHWSQWWITVTCEGEVGVYFSFFNSYLFFFYIYIGLAGLIWYKNENGKITINPGLVRDPLRLFKCFILEKK